MKILEKVSKEIVKGKKFAKAKNAEIAIALNVAGAVGTFVLSAYGEYKAGKARQELSRKKEESGVEPNKNKDLVDNVLVSLPYYIPGAAMATITVVSGVKCYKWSADRTAAFASAYHIADKRLHDYQAKVIEKYGEKKEKAVRDEVAADYVNQNPPVEKDIISANGGDTLCLDKVSGRYFRCDMDTLRKAENKLNRMLFANDYVSVNEFYDEIGLDHIAVGDDIGWNISECIDLDFSSCLAANNEPCLVVDFCCRPRYDYSSNC